MSFRARGIRDEDFGVSSANPAAGMTSGLVIKRTEDQTAMAKAKRDGMYVVTGDNGETHNFFVVAGDEIPEGATFAEIAPTLPADEPAARAKGPAPENRARAEKPESR